MTVQPQRSRWGSRLRSTATARSNASAPIPARSAVSMIGEVYSAPIALARNAVPQKKIVTMR